MAAKHDGKHARANMWVTHQNLARAKGGRPHYQFKERKVFTVQKGVSAPPAVTSLASPASPASPPPPPALSTAAKAQEPPLTMLETSASGELPATAARARP